MMSQSIQSSVSGSALAGSENGFHGETAPVQVPTAAHDQSRAETRLLRQSKVPFSQVLKAPPGAESVDFDLHECQQYRHFAASREGSYNHCRRRLTTFLLARWILIMLVGIGTGLTAVFIDFGLKNIFWARYYIMQKLLEYSPVVLLLSHVGMCTSLAAIAAMFVCYVEPLAAGSGIPEVKCRLNGISLPNVVHPRTYVSKSLGILFSVGAGLPCGKEGPMIHCGSIVGAMLSKWGAQFDLPQYHFETEERDFISSGAAAGVAAAFGAPLGGVLFAMEEGSSFWNVRVLLRSFVCSSMSALVLNFFLVGWTGFMGWGSLGSLGVLTFGTFVESDATSYRIWELPLFGAIGVIGGLVGALFNGLNILLTKWRMRVVKARGHRRFIEALLVTICISTAHYIVPLASRTCYVPKVTSTRTGGTYLSCLPADGDGSYDGTVGLFVAPSEDTIKVLFHEPQDLDNLVLLAFAVMYFSLACWTYGLGVPSGLFVPSLTTGAAIGRLCGQVLKQTLGPTSGNVHPGSYALIGAAASLAGMARITISLAVILVEATGNIQWTLPVLFTVMTAKWTGDFFNKGIYDVHIHLKHVPLLEPFAEPDMKHMSVSDVMTRDVVLLERLTTVGNIVEILERFAHHGFPVVEPSSRQLCGMVPRSVLIKLLHHGRSHGAFQNFTDRHGCIPPHGSVPYGLLSKDARGESIDEVKSMLNDDELLMFIDLSPYVNKSSYRVPEHMTLRRAYLLFRTMGLRHVPVVSNDSSVCGILTRKDLILVDS